MTREDKIQAIIDYFEDNEDIFNDCIEDLDNCNGTLGDDRYEYMDDIDVLFSFNLSDVLRMAFYGEDESGGEFCPNRTYFKIDGCGNLFSADSKDYSDFLNESIVEEMSEWDLESVENNPELSALFEALNEDEEDEDEADEE